VSQPDPTVNVKEQLAAALQAQDKQRDSAIDKLQVVSDLRAKYETLLQEASTQRTDDLRAAESRRVNENIDAERRRVDERIVDLIGILTEQASSYERVRIAEAARVDANRAEDKLAAALAAERSASALTLLANTQATTAETLRNQVATTATTTLAQQQSILNPLIERVAQLEQTSYKGQGRAQEADPALAAALLTLANAQKVTAEKLDTLRTVQTTDTGRGLGMNQLWIILAGVVAVGATLYGILRPLIK